MSRRTLAPGKRRERSLLFAVLGLALAGIAWIAMAWLMQRLQAARCPQDAFCWASSQIATALQVAPLAFPSLGPGFLAANWIAASIPGGGQFFNQARDAGPNDPAVPRQLLKFCSMLLAATLPVSFAASLCLFCLQPQAIAYQPYPWTGLRHYAWQDVVTLTADCRYRSGRYAGWYKQLILGMRDGAALDLMTWPAAAVRAYPKIARALHGQAYSFDKSGVDRGCPPPYLRMLTERP